MARGKQTCRILKEIRRNIAEANGIEFVTSECRYKGDCLGTCPKCEAEVRYLERELRARSLAGKAVTLAGISAASLAMFMPVTSQAQSVTDTENAPADNVAVADVDAAKLKGRVTDGDSINAEVMIGATVKNLTNGKITLADVDGKFEIDAVQGDSIQVSFVCCETKTICVTDVSKPVTVALEWDQAALCYLEQQQRARSLAMLAPMTSQAQTVVETEDTHSGNVTVADVEAAKLKGRVTDSDSINAEVLIGAAVVNLTNGKKTVADIDGMFEIEACKGDSIQVSYVGYETKTINVTDVSSPVTVALDEDRSELMGEFPVLVGAYGPQKPSDGTLDLIITDEKGNRISAFDIDIYRLYADEDGDEDDELLSPAYIDNYTALRLYWNDDRDLRGEDDTPLKEAVLRVEVDGYDNPKIIKVKYPKRHTTKTIRLKHRKK